MANEIAVMSVGYNRPELHEISLDYLNVCRCKESVDLHIYIDDYKGDTRTKGLKHRVNGFGCVEFHGRKERNGLSRNILYGLQELMESNYQMVIILENDVLVSKDFIELFIYGHKNLDLCNRDCMSMTGFSTSSPDEVRGVPAVNVVYRAARYSSLGVGFTRLGYDIIKPYIKPELLPPNEEKLLRDGLGPIGELMNRLKDRLIANDPSIATEWDEKGKPRGRRQATLCNIIRSLTSTYTMCVAKTRCTHVGGYGMNNRGPKLDMRDRKNWKGIISCNQNFQEDNQWDELTFVGDD